MVATGRAGGAGRGGHGLLEAAAVALAAAWLAAARPAAAQETGPPCPEAVTSTVRAFHGALAAGDSARALGLLHPDVRVFEGGHAETLAEYRSGHLTADMAFSGSVGRRVLEEHVFGGADEAVYLSEYRVKGTFRGEEVDARGAETMVLVREEDGWRIRHIHWSSR